MTTKNYEKEEMRKQQIMQSAFQVIASRGYNNFTIEDIANNAGLSKGGVLHYFKTKEDILIYLLEQIYHLIEENIIKRSGKYKSPERKLKAILISFVATAKRNPAIYTVMVDFWAQVPINERVKNINSKIYDIISLEVKKHIDEGIENGEFAPVNSLNAAHMIVSMMMNVSIQWVLNSSIYNIDHMTRICMSTVLTFLTNTSRSM